MSLKLSFLSFLGENLVYDFLKAETDHLTCSLYLKTFHYIILTSISLPSNFMNTY